MSRAARTFDSLRAPKHPPADIDSINFAVAIARLADTQDGQLLIAWLRQTSTEIVMPEDASDSALRRMEGRRQVPQDLERIIERGRREFKRSE